MNSNYDSERNRYLRSTKLLTVMASFDSTLTLERLINSDFETALFDGVMTLFFGGLALYNYWCFKDYNKIKNK